MVREIDKDLVQWSRRKWAIVVCFVLAAQVGLMLAGSRQTTWDRPVYPQEPGITFAFQRGDPMEQEWLELENPFLFATANWQGFSGDAWLRKPEWHPPRNDRATPVRFLGYAEAARGLGREPAREPFAMATHRRPSPVLPEIRIPEPPMEQRSNLSIEGLRGRPLSSEPPLPVQYHNDYVTTTVVEALVDRDGLVISARLIERSGSAKADADALTLAGQARFAPAANDAPPVEVGKLIFHWFALDLSHTNNVKR